MQLCLQEICDNMFEGLVLLDKKNFRILQANKEVLSIFEVKSIQELQKIDLKKIIAPSDLQKVQTNLLLPKAHPYKITVTINGKKKFLLVRGVDIKGQKAIRVSMILELTKQINQELIQKLLDYYDPLTKIYNRSTFIEHLHQQIALHKESGCKSGLASFDIDYFRQINDRFGHNIGDRVLQEMANRLMDICLRECIFARIGDDEFALAMELCSPQDQERFLSLLRKLKAALEEPYSINEHKIYVRLSVGYTFFDGNGDVIELLRALESTLVTSKKRNRGEILEFQDHYLNRIREKVEIKNAILEAIESGGVKQWYQPKVAVEGNVAFTDSYETLMRLAKSAISPAQFIPVAEESGLVMDLFQISLKQACQATKSHGVKLSVNVSPAQFRFAEFIEIVKAIVVKEGIDPRMLTFEVTENVLIEDMHMTIKIMEEIADLGIG